MSFQLRREQKSGEIMRKNMIRFMLRYSSSSRDCKNSHSSFLSMYFEYFSYFIRLRRFSEPRLDDVKKRHKLYPFIIPSVMKKKWNEFLFWFVFAVCSPHALLFLACVGDLRSLSRWRANIITDYLHIYAAFCLLLIIV